MLYKPLERHPKEIIDVNIIKKFLSPPNRYPGKSSTLNEIGQVWERVLSRWTLSSIDVFKSLENKDIDELKHIYENYYIYGVSDGASTGKAFECENNGGNSKNYKINKNKRNQNRILQLGQFLEIEHNDVHDVINLINKKYNLPPQINNGQTWGWWYDSLFIHFELADYIYFLETVLTVLKDLNLTKTLFLGDGSGVLSTLIYNNYNINTSYHIDLGHFLLKQYINNHNNSNIHYHYAEEFDPSTVMDVEILINQDSFPEMSDESVEKYIKSLVFNKIPYVLSYNKNVTFEGNCKHSDWKSKLLENGYKVISKLSPTMREGYKIELFKLQN